MEVFIEKAFDYGLPTVLLFLLLLGMWKAVAWLGPNFLTPIKDQIVTHLTKLDAAIDAMMELIRGQTLSIQKQNEVLDRVEEKIERTVLHDTDSSEILKRIDGNVQSLHDNASRFFRESHTEHERNNGTH